MFVNRCLPLFLNCFIILYFKEYSYVAVPFLVLLWFYKYRDLTVILLIILSGLIISSTNIPYATIYEGKIVQLTTNSIVIEHKGVRTLVSNCKIRDYDSIIQVEGKGNEIQSAPSSFGFSFETWAKQQSLNSSIYATTCHKVKEGTTIRRNFQKIIEQHPQKEYLNKTFFNVSSDREDFVGVLNAIGFPFVGFLLILRKLLRFFMYEKSIRWIEGFLIFLNLLITGFSFVSLRILFSYLCRFIHGDSKFRTGCFGFLCLLSNINQCTSLSFIIPFGFRLLQVTTNHKKIVRFLFICVIQSFFFSKIHVGLVFFYFVIVLIQGLMTCYSILLLFFPFLGSSFYELLSSIVDLLHVFELTGNPKGFGLILYLLVPFCFKKHRMEASLVIYLLFIQFGFFHPLSELVFLQIGQGDSMLIREAFNQKNILIDTGSSKNYELLKSNLEARTIHKIDVIFITHYDEDHAGNLGSLMNDFEVKEVIDTTDSFTTQKLKIESLNQRTFEEDNDNSLIHFIQMNQTHFLMMADASKQVEHNLLKDKQLLNIDILKIGHHGSKTSTSKALLTKSRPKLAIISSGLNNRYGHPHQETLELLNKFNVYTLNTAQDGDISIFFTRFLNFILTSRGKIGIISRW
ncbi:ComEC/Rec2 family competence protein [Anaerorhabdus furcosa]|uniref:Metallo-beta-lactamase superfamily protein n=1 Tax=Anaerorhabdus furcosa TaxID=118967 RepID=A0A1T4PGC1_9FIRM|nr:MBL fold metallo-hydrolase [Anaerorhabdus furcosa]SJZ90605.1 Metallo-beta-lactamase superfamily protein [Anaerorhabdus furcosa]